LELISIHFVVTLMQVESLKPSNPWNDYAGVEVKTRTPKQKSLKYGLTQADVGNGKVDMSEVMSKYF
jgi:hypothetical protein